MEEFNIDIDELEREIQELEEEVQAFDDHINTKAMHRLSRKMKRLNNKREDKISRNTLIGITASRYGKRMLHRYNRRHEVASENYYKNEYSFSRILWELS